MPRMRWLVLVAITIVALACPVWAANYYVDPTYNGSNGTSNGSFSRPWTTIAQVNAATLADGDDLYFRTGTTVNVGTTGLSLRWSGTSTNPSVIGSYYVVGGQPVHGLPASSANSTPWVGVGDRPTLDGQNWNEAGNGDRWGGAIEAVNKPGYYIVENLHIYRSPGPGITLKSLVSQNPALTTRKNVVRNCRIVESFRQGITLVQNTESLVENNYVWRGSYGRFVILANKSDPASPWYGDSERIVGAGIESMGQGQALYSRYNVIRGNIVRQSHEGIGLYKDTQYCTAENNTVYDCQNVNIYYANSTGPNTVRNNIAYYTPEKRGLTGFTGVGIYGVPNIMADCEVEAPDKPTGRAQIYGNYLANGRAGVQLTNQSYQIPEIGHKGHRIYNNRSVNATYNYAIRLIEASAANLTGDNRNFVYGNYSFLYRPDSRHYEQAVMPGYVWGINPSGAAAGNYYTHGPTATTYSVSGIAATNAQINRVALQKTTGWDNLPSTPGAVTRDFWTFTGEAPAPTCQSDPAACDASGCATYWPSRYWYNDGCHATPEPVSGAYYVDPTYDGANGTSNGSFSRPWTTIAQVNAYQFAAGDDVYFRADRTINASTTRLVVDWYGTSTNPAIIGAYYVSAGSPVHTLVGASGVAKPIIDGGGVYPTDPQQGLLSFTATGGNGYVVFQDLHIKDSYGVGILINHETGGGSVGNIVRRCTIIGTGQQGVLLARTSYGLVENNTISKTSHTAVPTAAGVDKYAGAAIEVTAMGNESFGQHNIIRGNIVSKANESIGIYKGARYTTVEDNVVYDMSGTGIYAANARDGTIKNNLVYNVHPDDAYLHPRWASYGVRQGRRNMIWIDCEGHVETIIKVTGGWKILNNYVAGGAYGVKIDSNANDVGVYQSNNQVVGNLIVDCDYNIGFSNPVAQWTNNIIEENTSFALTSAECAHVSHSSPAGITWDGNRYNTPPTVTGNAATNAVFNGFTLQKTTGWRNLTPGAVTINDFAFAGGSVPTPTCQTDYTLCTATGCATYWPDMYWCPSQSGCQPSPCPVTEYFQRRPTIWPSTQYVPIYPGLEGGE